MPVPHKAQTNKLFVDIVSIYAMFFYEWTNLFDPQKRFGDFQAAYLTFNKLS